MLPVILAAVGGYLVYDSLKSKKYADGGMMDDGGEVGEGFLIRDMREKLKRMFPDTFGFSVGNVSKEGNKTLNSAALIVDENDPYHGLEDKDIQSKLFFPQYKRDHNINFRVMQGGENTYFYFALESEKGDEYIGQFGFKDRGDVPSSYITRFLAFLMEQYGLPFSIKQSVMADGGMMAKGGTTKGGEKYEVLSPDGITIEFDKPYYTSRKKAYEAFDKWKKRYEAQGYYSSNNRRIPLDELENYMTIRELDGGKNLGMMKEKLPKHLEEKLAIIAKWNNVNIKDVIDFLNAIIDSGLTDDDLKTNPTKNTRFQRERATEKKIKEIWEKIEPNYKGRLKGNHYYGIIKEIISSGRLYSNDSGALLKDFKPYRNKF
jgi:hypothetical protein